LTALSTARSLDNFYCNLSLDVCDKLQPLNGHEDRNTRHYKTLFYSNNVQNKTIQIYSNLKCIISMKMLFFNIIQALVGSLSTRVLGGGSHSMEYEKNQLRLMK